MYTAICLSLMLAISPTFWSDVFAQTPVKVIAAAGVVYGLTQLVKKALPNLGGPYAMAVNLLFSVASVFVGMRPENFWSETTLAQVIAIFAAAAGVHGTTKALSKPADSDKPIQNANPSPTIKGAGALAFVFLLTVGMTGCLHAGAAKPLPTGAVDSTDANANIALQTIHAFLGSVATQVQAGKLTLTMEQRGILDRADAAFNTAATAEQTYHAAGGGSSGALLAALKAAQASFVEAQASLGQGIAK